jgi:hypothetical protein
MSFPINADIPFSSCNGGMSVIHGVLDDCNLRIQANATRAHSAIARKLEEVVDAEDEERLDRVPIFGEVDTLLRERCSRGDWGREVDLRRTLRRGLSFISDEDGCSRTEGADFPGLLNDFRVVLMTSVAKMAFSFGDNSSPESFPSL